MTLKGSRMVATGGMEKRTRRVPRSVPTHSNVECRMRSAEYDLSHYAACRILITPTLALPRRRGGKRLTGVGTEN
jgi:hypothetical protein